MTDTSRKGLRLISFDGGGIRGLSQLRIMDTIIHRIQCDWYPNDPDKVVLPCECFDLMGGSDTGAVIAVMFSILRMSVKDATEEFHKICNEVYVDGLSTVERTERLRKAIADLLRRRGLPEDLKLERGTQVAEDECPCFVLATPKANMEAKVKLRSYRTRIEPSSNVTVVDAILATCATQPTFLAISVGSPLNRQELIGGVTDSGNPGRELISEAYNLFGKDIHVSTIMSIGSGRLGALAAPSVWGKDEWMDVLRDMVKGCERVAQDMETQMGHLGIYHRFSVEQGLQRIYGADANDIGWLNTQVNSYLDDAQVSRKLDHCVESIRLRQGQVTLEQLKHSPGGQPIYKGMPPLTSYFVMRREPWEKMKRGLIDDETEEEEQRIMVISGMGGCGKTQLVIRFTKEFKRRFKFVFFVDGSTRESVQADIINHVRTANTAYSQATFKEAISFFCNPHNLPWMAVYDNVDDIQMDVTSLIPECTFGVIIITTRTQARGQLASSRDLHIQLDVMSMEEAIDTILLSAHMERTDDTIESVKAIAEELGNLPVALVQAGSYMLQRECSCEQYLDRLHRHKAEMMYMPAGDRLHRSAYHAFDLSIQRIRPHVRGFLHIIGCMHYADFPIQAITVAAKKEFRFDQFALVDHDAEFEASVRLLKNIFFPDGFWDERILDNIVTELKNYSLASFTRSSRSLLLRMHPLMHQWTLVHLTPEKRVSYQLAASRLLACSYNEDTFQQYLMAHVDSIVLQSSNFPMAICDKATFGHVLRKMRRVQNSKAIWEPIYVGLIQHYGDQDLRVATAALELAATCIEDLETAERLEKQAIGIRERVLGAEHLETLDAKAELSGTYELRGNLRDAELLGEQVLTSLTRHLDPTHDKVIESMHWLGEIYRSQGRYSDAELVHESVLKIRKERLSDTHPDTLSAMHNLALTYHSQGRHSDAEPLQQHMLKIRKELLGDSHFYTLSAMHNLALTYYVQGHYSSAEPLQQHVYKIRKERLGDTHPDTLSAMHNLALQYHSLGRYSEAELLQQDVLKIRKERLGETHTSTLQAMGNLASTHYSQGRYAEAQPLQENMLKECLIIHGDHHSYTALAMNNLGWTYYYLGKLSEAKEVATQAEKVRKITSGVDHPEYKKVADLLLHINQALARRNSST